MPSEKAPATPEEVMYQNPTEACVTVAPGAEAVAVTPEKPDKAFLGATSPAKSPAAIAVGKEAAAVPVALWAYFMAKTLRRLPRPPLAAAPFAAPCMSMNLGSDIVAKIPMMAITITSSINVNP